MKLRDEFETLVGDGVLLLRIFEELGYQVWFRYEKYREEFAHEDVIVAIDETPVGVFVEIEGSESGITAMAAAMGRGPDDYLRRLLSRSVPPVARSARAHGCRHGFRPPDNASAVLTAGLGTRLQPLTRARAKAAAPVDGEPLARRTIRWLVSARHPAISSSTSITSRNRSPRRSATDADLGARVRYSWESPVLGSAGGPRHALPLLLDLT